MDGPASTGHVTLENVMFAPLVLGGKAVGLLGLANKPGGFSEEDATLADAFSEFAALGLLNSRTLESLEHGEERFGPCSRPRMMQSSA